jgi:ketosteroid isomerase-like protein
MMAFFELVDGKFEVEVHDVVANDDHVVGLVRVTIGKDGRTLEFDEAHVWHVVDGRVTQMWAVPVDPYEVDDFFAAVSSDAGD